MPLNNNIKICDRDSSLSLGMTCRCLLYKGKQRRFAQRIASAFPYITKDTVIPSVSEKSHNQFVKIINDNRYSYCRSFRFLCLTFFFLSFPECQAGVQLSFQQCSHQINIRFLRRNEPLYNLIRQFLPPYQL
jgi:hypothetical protein